ncbi:hypothetical protein ACJ72_02765 [Emergomyces africanus]|uniref:Uncharacterized protein n=1 Tax=Emergomyces africanus TaxID=1955775 RepID=A0A1B7P1H6_9EURO|nr:hypothetical protein ACJ72_02765 [Emergomyces africanus]
MKVLWALAMAIAPLSRTSPANLAGSLTVTIPSPQTPIIGGERPGTEFFPGAHGTPGNLRGRRNRTGLSPVFFSAELNDAIPTTPLGKLLNTTMF